MRGRYILVCMIGLGLYILWSSEIRTTNVLLSAAMRERITFIHDINEYFDPSQLRLSNDTLHITSLKAVREDRLTIGLYELPQEVPRSSLSAHCAATDRLIALARIETMS